MPSAHEHHRKTIEPYTLAVTDTEKRLPSFCKKLEAYPTVRKHLFPNAEGEKAYRQLSSSALAFETGIPNVTKVAKSLSRQSESYLRMLTQDHLHIGEYVRLVSEDAYKTVALGTISDALFEDVLDALSVTSDEILLAARRAPSACLVPADLFAFFGLEMAELRTDLRRLRASLNVVQKAYGQDIVHDALCPNCLAKAVCHASSLN